MINKIKQFFQKYWAIIIIILLSLAPFIWFRDGLLIAGGDNYWYLDPGRLFSHALYTWTTFRGGGDINFTVSSIFPFYSFWVFFKFFSLKLVNIQRLWTILMLIAPSLSMYYLVTNLFGKKNVEQYKLAGLLAAVLYTFNMFIINSPMNAVLLLVLAVWPLMLLWWIKALSQVKFNLKYPILISLISIFLFYSAANLATVSVIPITLFLYFLYFLAFNPKRILHALKVASTTIFFYLLINIWWIAINYLSIIETANKASGIIKTVTFLTTTQIFETFRLMGFWAFKSFTEKGVYNVPYSHFYYETVLVLFTYLIPILAFFILFCKHKSKKVLFFALMTLVGIFLSKGDNEPFGFVYQFLYDHVPGFWVFREPYTKFTPMTLFSLAILFGLTMQIIYSKYQDWFGKRLKPSNWSRFLLYFLPILMVLFIIITSFPTFTGRFLADISWYNRRETSMHVDVPDYWYEAQKWFQDNDPEGRVLLLPKAAYGHCYDWPSGTCTGGYVANIFLPNPVISYPSVRSEVPYDIIVDRVLNHFGSTENRDLSKLLSLFGVKYILQQNDLMWERTDTYSPEHFKRVFNNQAEIKYIKSFGRLDLYQVSDYAFTPKVNIPKNLFYLESQEEIAPDNMIIETKRGAAEGAYIYIDQNENKQIARDPIKAESIKLIEPKYVADQKEYVFEAPEDGTYEFYLKKQLLPPELVVNSRCPGNVGVEFDKSLFKEEAVETDIEIRRMYLNDSQRTDLSWQSDTKIYCFDSSYIGTAKISKPWAFISDSGSETLYESLLSSDFPADYRTNSQLLKHFFIGFNGNKELIKKWGTLDQFGSFEIGGIVDRRIVINIPSGTEPSVGSYRVNYLKDHELFDSIIAEKNSGSEDDLFLGKLVLNKGKNRFRVDLVSSRSKRQPIEQDFVIKLTQPNTSSFPSRLVYKQINPTKYKIIVEGAETDFLLTMADNFHPFWRAYIDSEYKLTQREILDKPFSPQTGDGPVDKDYVSYVFKGVVQNNNLRSPFYKTYFKKPIDESRHLVVNGYANSWLINVPTCSTGNKCQDFEIILEFWPQRVYYAFILISSLSFISLFLYLIGHWGRYKRQENNLDYESDIENN